MVLRHLTLLSRPSSIDGVVWEDKHEPQVLFDATMFASCLFFFLIVIAFGLIGDMIGVGLFLVVTLFSTLSDSIYYNHYWLDTIDRFTAIFGSFYLIYTGFIGWVIALDTDDILTLETASKLVVVSILSVPPFWCLNNSRSNPVRSDNWRWYHSRWHVYGSLNASISILLVSGFFDDFSFSENLFEKIRIEL